MPQDDAAAVNWYRKAVEQGYARGQTNLGFMYRKGHGVPQDDAEAVNWYRKAAEQGNAYAQANLGVMYELGRGVTPDEVQAHLWYSLAADQGNEFAATRQNFLAAKMSVSQITDAERRAREWLDQHHK